VNSIQELHFIDRKREAKPSSIQILNPQKINPRPEIFGQLNQQNINRHYYKISVIMTSGFKETPVISFKEIQSIDALAVS